MTRRRQRLPRILRVPGPLGRRLVVAAGGMTVLLPVLSEGTRAAGNEGPTSEQTAYVNGKVTLVATLRIPAGEGPFPGAVIVHGSGNSDRSNPWTSAYVDALVRRGIAVLYPDKRGSGESEGNWREATFEDLADDALAGLDRLGAHPAVDGARVGLIGFSQGGDIVPLAATRSEAVSFVVDVSGSVVPIHEQIGDELRMMGEREGLDPHALERVADIHERAMRFARSGEGWDAYRAALDAARREGLGDARAVGGFPTDREDPIWGFVRLVADFDPLPYWKRVSVPAVFLYGGHDENVDVAKSWRVLEESLATEGPRYSVLFFRNNAHALFRDDAMDFVARWIHDGGVD